MQGPLTLCHSVIRFPYPVGCWCYIVRNINPSSRIRANTSHYFESIEDPENFHAMLLPFAATFAGLALAGPTTTCTRSSSSTCSLTICADYINSCSQTYGGCYPACSGYTTPSFTDPGCPPTTKGPPPTTTTGGPQTSDCFSTVIQTVCSPTSTSPTSSRPECPVTVTQTSCSQIVDPNSPTRSTTTTTTPPPSSATCTETLCIDNINSCSQWYGGWFPACPGYTTPSFSDPGCPSVTTSCSSSSKSSSSRDPCEWVCLDYFDQCGNTFGPGCWTSCPGGAVPTYATPYCDVEAGATATG